MTLGKGSVRAAGNAFTLGAPTPVGKAAVRGGQAAWFQSVPWAFLSRDGSKPPHGPWEEERGGLAAASFCLQQDSEDPLETVVRVTRPPTL